MAACSLGFLEVIFVPQGTPHYVENVLELPTSQSSPQGSSVLATIAYGGNFVDETNVDQAIFDMSLMEGKARGGGGSGPNSSSSSSGGTLPSSSEELRSARRSQAVAGAASSAAALREMEFNEYRGRLDELLRPGALCVKYDEYFRAQGLDWRPNHDDLLLAS